jgi:hypothetical protein
MGGSVSSVQSIHHHQQQQQQQLSERPSLAPPSEADIIRLLMPMYFTMQPLQQDELNAANHVWKLIVRNQCAHFNAIKAAHPEKNYQGVAEYLHTVFYERLFLVHPSCRSLFQRAVSKMNLIPMISMFLTKLDQPDQLRKSLLNLVNVHNKIGIKAVECKYTCICELQDDYTIYFASFTCILLKLQMG